jgi:hypothetical protein
MSFNLPRNPRDLRFTGELRAQLGRARKTPRDVYQADPVRTPFVSGPPAASIEILDELLEDDDDDDAPTTLLDREGRDILPGGFDAAGSPSARARAGAKPAARPQATAPIPNFRAPPETPSVIVAPEPLPATPPRREGPPLAFWLVAAVFAAGLSYKVAPMAVNQADSVVHLFDAHGAASE